MAGAESRGAGGEFLPQFGLSQYAVRGALQVGLRDYALGMERSAELVEDMERRIERLEHRRHVRVRFLMKNAPRGFRERKYIAREISDDVWRIARQIGNLSRTNAPIDTGRLKKSTTVPPPLVTKTNVAIAVHMDPKEQRKGGDHFYGMAVHENHRTMSHFMDNAFTAMKEKALQKIERAIVKAVS